PTTHFGFRKITVERPLRLNFQASPERIARLGVEAAFRGLAVSRKKGAAKEREEAEGRAQQEALLATLRRLPDTVYKDRDGIDTSRRDPKDGEVGIVGYEINFNRYFYQYTPPRPLEEIEADIRGIEQDILRMLAEVTGGR